MYPGKLFTWFPKAFSIFLLSCRCTWKGWALAPLTALCCWFSHRGKRNQHLPAFRALTAALVFCDLGLHAGAGPQPLLSGRRLFQSFLFLCPFHSLCAGLLSSLRLRSSGRLLSPWYRSEDASFTAPQTFQALLEAHVSIASAHAKAPLTVTLVFPFHPFRASSKDLWSKGGLRRFRVVRQWLLSP